MQRTFQASWYPGCSRLPRRSGSPSPWRGSPRRGSTKGTSGSCSRDTPRRARPRCCGYGTSVVSIRPNARSSAGCLAAFILPGELRRPRQWRLVSRWWVDPERTMRATMLRGRVAMLSRLQRRRHWQQRRRVILLVDVNGSMSSYADVLLWFAHAAARRQLSRVLTDVFTIGMRLTWVVRELLHLDSKTVRRTVSRTCQTGTRVVVSGGASCCGRSLTGEVSARWLAARSSW